MAVNKLGFFIETGLPGGAEEMMFSLVRIAISNNYEVKVFHFKHDWIKNQCAVSGAQSIEIPFQKNFKSTSRLPLFAVQFSKLLKKEGISLLHSHLFGPVVGGGLASFLARIPHVATLHDVYMLEEKPSRAWLLRLVALLGAEFVTVSNHMREFYLENCGLPGHRVRTIYNYCDSIDKDSRREDDGLVRIVVVGRLIPLKHVDKVIDAFLTLNNVRKSAKLLIVGEGESRASLESIVPPGMKSQVEFLGRREDVQSILAAADIFVQYSETEGLSMSIIEALSAGLPAVVSDVGGNSEIVMHGVNGYLVSVDDDKQLLSCMESLVDNAELRRRMGYKGREHAKQCFSRQQFSASYLDLYSSMQKKKVNTPGNRDAE